MCVIHSLLGPNGVQTVWFDRVGLGPDQKEDTVGMDTMQKLIEEVRG